MEALRLRDPRDVEWVVELPRTPRERRRGLLGRSALPASTGMLFRDCRSIHTLRMRFGLDIVFLDAAMRVIDVHPTPPGRWRVHRARASHVLEVPVGSGLRPGDVLRPS